MLRGLAELLGRSGESANALALLADHADAHPRDLRDQLLAFDLALHSGNVPVQDRALKRIVDIEGNDALFGLYCQARQAIVNARRGGDAKSKTKLLAEARQNLNDVAKRRKNWEKVSLALAEIDEMQGDKDATIKHLVEAVKLGERDPIVIRRTFRLLAENKQGDQANDLLERVQGSSLTSGEVQRLASELYYQNHDLESALNSAEKAVEPGSTDYRDHLWLSQMRG